MQLQQLLSRERLDAVTARDETDLARLREMTVDENDEEAAAALAGATQLPSWLGRLEDEMGRNSEEPAWGQLEPDAKRRRVARFDSMSDAAIYRQRQREGEEKEEREEGRGKGDKKEKRKKKKAATSRLVAAPADAACVKCLVEETSPQGTGEEEELAVVLCPGCDNPFHRAWLGPGHKHIFAKGRSSGLYVVEKGGESVHTCTCKGPREGAKPKRTRNVQRNVHSLLCLYACMDF